MAQMTQARTIGTALGGVALLAVAIGAWSLFAPPERERDLPAMPPIVLPGTTSTPAIGHAAPASSTTRAKPGVCDGAEGATVRRPRPLTPPQSWFTSDDYPTLALMARHGGVTTTELVIDATGRVIGCGVAIGSGHFSLDRRSCAVFHERARFTPAEDDRGCPVPAIWHQRVRWVIGN